MIKNYKCTNCGFDFKKTLSDKFIKSVRLECPSCGSHEVAEITRVDALVNKKNK